MPDFGLGIFMLSFLEAGVGLRRLVPGMVVLGLGIGLFYLDHHRRRDVARCIPFQPGRRDRPCQVAGGALGLGINTAIVLSQSELPEGIRLAFRHVDAALLRLASSWRWRTSVAPRR